MRKIDDIPIEEAVEIYDQIKLLADFADMQFKGIGLSMLLSGISAREYDVMLVLRPKNGEAWCELNGETCPLFTLHATADDIEPMLRDIRKYIDLAHQVNEQNRKGMH